MHTTRRRVRNVLAVCVVVALGWGSLPAEAALVQDAFVDTAVAAGLYDGKPTLTWGAYAADHDGDGDEDILVNLHYQYPTRLYRNNGNQTFAEIRKGTFINNDRHDCDWGDVNNDSRLDVYCSRGAESGTGAKKNTLHIQRWDGSFVDQATAWGVEDPYGRGRSVVFLDVNKDGWLDLFVGNGYPRKDLRTSQNRLFINTGLGFFRSAAEYGVDVEVGAFCAQAVDFDHDGWTDLIVCGQKRPYLYRNVRGTGFVDVAQSKRIQGWWTDIEPGDVNNDGRVDLILANVWGSFVRLQQANGTFGPPVFSDGADKTMDVAVGDFNGDKVLDFYLTRKAANGVNQPDALWLGSGGGKFSKATIPQVTSGSGDRAEPIDIDGDGTDELLVLHGYDTTRGPIQLLSIVE